MVRYYYSINSVCIDNAYWTAYSPQFPEFSTTHTDNYTACALLVDVILADLNQRLAADKSFPQSYRAVEYLLLSWIQPVCVTVLPVYVDEEKVPLRIGAVQNSFGFPEYYLPIEYLYTKNGLYELAIQDAEKAGENKPPLSKSGYGYPNIREYPYHLPELFHISSDVIINRCHAFLNDYLPASGSVVIPHGMIKDFLGWAIPEAASRLKKRISRYPLREILICALSQYELLDYLFEHMYGEISRQKISEDTDFGDLKIYLQKREAGKSYLHRYTQHLIEFSISEYPRGSEHVTESDYESIFADLVILVSLIYVSSNIHSFPEIDSMSFGDTGFGVSGDIALRTKSYREGCAADILLMRNGEYKKYLEPGKPSEELSSAFDSAFHAEFGISVEELRELGECLAHFSSGSRFPFSVRYLCEIHTRLIGKYNWDNDKVETAINRFSLKAGGRWNCEDNLEQQFRDNSLYSHPLILLDDELCWCMRNWCSFVRDLFLLICVGKYQPVSSEMDEWISKYRNEETAKFVKAVANLINSETDCAARCNIKVSSIGETNRNFGDIDVAAADYDNNVLYSIECKHILSSHTTADARNRVDEFSRTDRRTYALKHLRRHNWLNENPDSVMNFFGFSKRPKIVSLFVVSHESVAKYFSDSVFPVITFSELMSKKKRALIEAVPQKE